jgi:periplasmic divalent cation tolerance protein
MQKPADTDVLTVTTTVSSPEAAQALAREILAHKLAACVQIDAAIHSLYHWDGALCKESELRLVIKTLPGCEAPLQALFAEHHPYELPQFVSVRAKASEAYFRWVCAEVAAPPAPR